MWWVESKRRLFGALVSSPAGVGIARTPFGYFVRFKLVYNDLIYGTASEIGLIRFVNRPGGDTFLNLDFRLGVKFITQAAGQ